jgi:hypothetical protein
VGHTALTVQYVLSVLLGHVSFALTVQYVLSVPLGHVSFALTVQYVLSVPLGHVSFALTVQYVLSVLLDHVSFACDCASRHVTVHRGNITMYGVEDLRLDIWPMGKSSLRKCI